MVKVLPRGLSDNKNILFTNYIQLFSTCNDDAKNNFMSLNKMWGEFVESFMLLFHVIP